MMSGSYSNGYQSATFSSSGTSVAGTTGDFPVISETINTNVQKVSQSVASMQKLVGQLGTYHDSESLRSQLHQVQHYTNQLVKDTNKHLKELAQIPNLPNASDQRDRKIYKERLTTQFSDALKNFQDVQRIAAQKEKESVMRARANSGLTGNPFNEASGPTNLIDLASPTQTQMMTSLQMEEEVNVELLNERVEAVQKLEADIVCVNEIFKDLAHLVHDQGDVIDSIEANVEESQLHVTEATQQLSKARDYQNKARRKIFCLSLVGIIALAVTIALIVVYG